MPALIVIPARGGSKGIPRKNLRLLGGRPLLSYAITAALAARCCGKAVVSTDDAEIAEFARRAGADVVLRSCDLALDTVPLDPVVLDAAERVSGDFDAVITVQATSPFVTPGDIETAYARLIESDANAVLTLTDDTHLTWTVEGTQLVPAYTARLNRQQLPRRLRETGAIVCSRKSALLTRRTRFVPPFAAMELDAARSIDIDSRLDWALAEAVLALRVITIVAAGADRMARQLAVANGLATHTLRLVVSRHDSSASALACGSFYDPVAIPDLSVAHLAPLAGDVTIIDTGAGGFELAARLAETGCPVIVVGGEQIPLPSNVYRIPDFAATQSDAMQVLPQVTDIIAASRRREVG